MTRHLKFYLGLLSMFPLKQQKSKFYFNQKNRITNIGTYYLDGYCTYPNGVKIDQVIPFSVKEGKDAGNIYE